MSLGEIFGQGLFIYLFSFFFLKIFHRCSVLSCKVQLIRKHRIPLRLVCGSELWTSMGAQSDRRTGQPEPGDLGEAAAAASRAGFLTSRMEGTAQMIPKLPSRSELQPPESPQAMQSGTKRTLPVRLERLAVRQ